MDLKGPIVDTNIYIKPSKRLLKYIQEIPFKESMPKNIAKIIKGKDYECSKVVQDKMIKVNIDLTIDEIEFMAKSIAEFKDNGMEKEEEQNDDSIDILNSENEINTYKSKDVKKAHDTTKVIKTKGKDKIKERKKGEQNKEEVEVNDTSGKQKEESSQEKSEISQHLMVPDLDWMYDYLQQLRQIGAKDSPYLHELLEGSEIVTPENEVMKRNPVLEARCVKLRAQQEAREYRAMTKGVDNVRIRFPEDSISYQLKQLNRQLIAVGQFLLSIFAGFLFGFTGIELMIGGIDFGFRLLLGVMCALIIALAEIYFLAKKLNEELSIPETTQLGGPTKFANHPMQINTKPNLKEHQD